MTAALLSLLDLLTQALPGVKGAGVTIKEVIAVTFALVSVIVVGVWVRRRGNKLK
jgi:hypothetical protein